MADGVIRNIKYARQRASFDGMRWGQITPTDIDGFVEFGDQVFIWIETKHGDKEIETGQRLALESSCDRVQKSGAEAIVLLVHKQDMGDVSPTYGLAVLPVTKYRYMGRWIEPKQEISCLEAINWFRKWAALDPASSSPAHVPVRPARMPVSPQEQSNEEWLKDYERAPSGT